MLSPAAAATSALVNSRGAPNTRSIRCSEVAGGYGVLAMIRVGRVRVSRPAQLPGNPTRLFSPTAHQLPEPLLGGAAGGPPGGGVTWVG